ncbi:MAG: TonB-dependent receptor [Panacagrimonas sp.]
MHIGTRSANGSVFAVGLLGVLILVAPFRPAVAETSEESIAADAPVYDSIPLPPEPAEEMIAPSIPKVTVLEEVIVTATKRAVDIRDIPLSIDAFGGDALREIGANDIDSIARFSPGVSVSPGVDPEAAQVIIRGVSTDTFFTFFTRTFGLFYEDVSLVNPSILGPQPNLDPFDMKTVEVLKGPQGTLFGGSALAGAIRYVPNRPDYESASARFAAGIGTLERSDGLSHRYDGMWNQPLGETVAMRIVASRSDNPGYVKDLRSGEDDINSSDATQLRGLLSWRASDDLEFRFSALRRETHQDDGAFANNDERPEHSKRFFPDVLDSTTDNLLLTTEWNLDFANLVMVLSQLDKKYPQTLDYSQFIGTSLVGIGTYGETGIKSSQPSAELRLASAHPTESTWWLLDEWDYVAGYFFVYSDQFLELELGTGLTGGLLNLRGDVDAKENAVFFDLTRPLSERWEFGVGGRYFRQSTKADISTTVVVIDGLIDTIPLLGVVQPVLDILPGQGGVSLGRDVGEIGETVFNPKFTLRWEYSDSFSLFASAVKGFRYAGANQNPTRDPKVPLFFDSDEIWNYEFGARTRWFDGSLQLDATVFQLDWEDLQVQQRDYTGLFAYTTNVGGARNRGVELSMDLLLPAGFALKLGAAYVNARTTTFFDDFQGPAPAGSELPGSPPFSGSGLLLWAGPIGAAQFSGTVSYTYQNRNYNNLPHTYEHPPLGLLGASASLRLPNWPGRPSFNLVGANLTNEFKPGVVFETPNSGGILTIFNPPRSVVLGVEFSFGGT